MSWLPDVRGHDDDGVLEVDRAALAVGEPAVVEDLEQDVEDVVVRLLDLVEEDDAVGPAAHGLGELAALVVADVAGRRADQPRDGVLLHVLGHVERGSSPARRRTGTRRARGRARSCRRRSGPRKMNEPIGRFGSLRPARARMTASATAATASSWPTTRWWRCSSRCEELLALALDQLRRPGCRSSARRPRRCPPRRPLPSGAACRRPRLGRRAPPRRAAARARRACRT